MLHRWNGCSHFPFLFVLYHLLNLSCQVILSTTFTENGFIHPFNNIHWDLITRHSDRGGRDKSLLPSPTIRGVDRNVSTVGEVQWWRKMHGSSRTRRNDILTYCNYNYLCLWQTITKCYPYSRRIWGGGSQVDTMIFLLEKFAVVHEIRYMSTTEIETISKCRKISTLIYKHWASGNPTNSKPEVTGGYRPLPPGQLPDIPRKLLMPSACWVLQLAKFPGGGTRTVKLYSM